MSTPDEDTATTLIKGLVSLLKEGGFERAKFSSNNVSVLEALPNDCLTPALTKVDFRVEELPGHQALGLVWEPQGDYLRIKVAMLSYPSTQRGLLSLVISLFDPLRIVPPFFLPLKLQRLSKLGLGWDAQISEEERVVWERLIKGFPKWSQIRVPRTFQGLTNSAENQLYVFADASNNGIGAICYLRTCINNTYFILFVMRKSRVAPIKPLSIPRMELSAAVVSVRLCNFIFVQRELDLYLTETVFWSHSTTVLSYLRNTSKRRPVFETNRINLICEFSSVDQ